MDSAGARKRLAPRGKVFRVPPRAAPSRGTGFPYTGHETTNQLSDDVTTTSIRQAPPAPATCAKLDTNAGIRICCSSQPGAGMPIYEDILRRPAVHPCPAPRHRAINPALPAKQKYQTNPISPNRACISTLPSILPPPPPPPQKNPASQAAKRGYQTNPIAHRQRQRNGPRQPSSASQQTQPSPAQIGENQNTKQTQFRLFTRFPAQQIHNLARISHQMAKRSA